MDLNFEYNIQRQKEEEELQKKKLAEFKEFIEQNKPTKEEIEESKKFSKILEKRQLDSQKAHEIWLQSMQPSVLTK